MFARAKVGVCLIVGLLGVSACGDDEKDDGGPSGPPTVGELLEGQLLVHLYRPRGAIFGYPGSYQVALRRFASGTEVWEWVMDDPQGMLKPDGTTPWARGDKMCSESSTVVWEAIPGIEPSQRMIARMTVTADACFGSNPGDPIDQVIDVETPNSHDGTNHIAFWTLDQAAADADPPPDLFLVESPTGPAVRQRFCNSADYWRTGVTMADPDPLLADVTGWCTPEFDYCPGGVTITGGTAPDACP